MTHERRCALGPVVGVTILAALRKNKRFKTDPTLAPTLAAHATSDGAGTLSCLVTVYADVAFSSADFTAI